MLDWMCIKKTIAASVIEDNGGEVRYVEHTSFPRYTLNLFSSLRVTIGFSIPTQITSIQAFY